MLPIIFVLPLVQLLVLSNAASFEIKNIKFSYIDNDHSKTSRELLSKFQASNYFTIIASFDSKKKQITKCKQEKLMLFLKSLIILNAI